MLITKRWLSVIVSMGALLVGARAWTQPADPKIIEGAKKEREVLWYTTTNLETSKVVVDQFQRKYPFINLSLYRTTVGPLINRVLIEARAG